MVYMISYDLHAPTNNRKELEDAIESLGAWCKYLTTTYLIKSNLSLSTIQANLATILDNNDSMIIVKVTNINGWLSNDKWDWINKNIMN